METTEHTGIFSARNAVQHPPACFHTRRLSIRRPVLSDIDALFDLNRNPDVTRWLHWQGHMERHQYQRDFDNYASKWHGNREYFWVLESTDCQLIGYVASRCAGNTADIGFVIDPPEWGRGYATEATSALVSQMSALADIERLVALCDRRNRASASVLRKSGLVYRGIAKDLIQCAQDADKRIDACLFDLKVSTPRRTHNDYAAMVNQY